MVTQTRLLSALTVLAFVAATGLLAQDGSPPKLPNFDRHTPIVLAVENVGPAVVSVTTKSRVTGNDFFRGFFQMPEMGPGNGQLAPRSLGSGVIIHPAGYVVTNDHVVSGAQQIEVQVMQGGKLNTFAATLINSDVNNDLAVLKIDAPGPFHFALLGDSDRLMVGESTIALGNPFGLAESVTTGILSAKNRSINMRANVVFKDFMQTSALINPGNSGGPLLDINGYVIGINVAIDNRGPGIGYAIPVNRVREVVTSLVDPEVVRRSWIGAEFVQAADGVHVGKVTDGTPAAKAELATGDRVVAVEGRPVDSRLAMHLAMLEAPKGSTLRLTVANDHQTRDVPIPIEQIPLSSAGTVNFDSVGIAVADVTPALARQFNIDGSQSGVIVTKIGSGSVAEETGLAPGDLLVQMGNFRIRNTTDLATVIGRYARGGRAPEIRVIRNGALLTGRIPVK